MLLDVEVQAVLQACRDLGTDDGGCSDDCEKAKAREALARRMREPEMAGKLRRLAAAGVVRFE